MERDIILIVNGGGMAGIFSAGVLKAFEEANLSKRIHSVYAVSVGACTAARFLSNQSELGAQTFYTKFNSKNFLRKNFLQYFLQVLLYWDDNREKIKDVLNFDYFIDIILNSENRIDMQQVLSSEILFFAKVFDVIERKNQYLLIQEPYAFEKVIASASMTPLTSKHTRIGDKEYFDGDTVWSDIEMDIIKKYPNKRVVRINNIKSSLVRELNPLTLCIVYILLRVMYGAWVANMYAKGFFKKPFAYKKLRSLNNVINIQNDNRISAFENNTERLKSSYDSGLAKGRQAVAVIR